MRFRLLSIDGFLMHFTNYAPLVVIFGLFLSSCSVLDPEEDIPAYIHISRIDLQTDLGTQGTNSHKIVDAWVFVNDNLLGAYELPATIPVLASGSAKVDVIAGIMDNGQATTRARYPYYSTYQTTLNLVPENVDTIWPIVEYFSTTQIWVEDFEDPGIKFNTTASSDTILELIQNTPEVFEGTGASVVYLTDTESFFEAKTDENFVLPQSNSSPVYLEINYKTNNSFSVGVYARNANEEVKRWSLIVNPSTDDNGVAQWNKIYADLTFVVSSEVNAIDYELYIEAFQDEGVSNPILYFDNIKLVHF